MGCSHRFRYVGSPSATSFATAMEHTVLRRVHPVYVRADCSGSFGGSLWQWRLLLSGCCSQTSGSSTGALLALRPNHLLQPTCYGLRPPHAADSNVRQLWDARAVRRSIMVHVPSVADGLAWYQRAFPSAVGRALQSPSSSSCLSVIHESKSCRQIPRFLRVLAAPSSTGAWRSSSRRCLTCKASGPRCIVVPCRSSLAKSCAKCKIHGATVLACEGRRVNHQINEPAA